MHTAMSRRPASDAIESVVVIASASPASLNADTIYQSNLLSNHNVIAFAKGVVVDDGSSAVSCSRDCHMCKNHRRGKCSEECTCVHK